MQCGFFSLMARFRVGDGHLHHFVFSKEVGRNNFKKLGREEIIVCEQTMINEKILNCSKFHFTKISPP